MLLQVPGHAHVCDLGAAADGHEGGGAADGAGHHAREGAAGPRHRPQEQDAGRQTQLEQGALSFTITEKLSHLRHY